MNNREFEEWLTEAVVKLGRRQVVAVLMGAVEECGWPLPKRCRECVVGMLAQLVLEGSPNDRTIH